MIQKYNSNRNMHFGHCVRSCRCCCLEIDHFANFAFSILLSLTFTQVRNNLKKSRQDFKYSALFRNTKNYTMIKFNKNTHSLKVHVNVGNGQSFLHNN